MFWFNKSILLECDSVRFNSLNSPLLNMFLVLSAADYRPLVADIVSSGGRSVVKQCLCPAPASIVKATAHGSSRTSRNGWTVGRLGPAANPVAIGNVRFVRRGMATERCGCNGASRNKWKRRPVAQQVSYA